MSKELQEIIARVKQFEPNEKAVLATVVDVRGSSYRLPGAKMLILENGETFGTVSGGCLEADVLERARRVLQIGEASVFTYDTTKTESSVFSLNMGCRGVIRILLEPVKKDSFIIRYLEIGYLNRDRAIVATLISKENDSQIALGGRVFFDKIEQFYFENLPEKFGFSQQLLNDCENYFYRNSVSHLRKYETENGGFEFFFENVRLPVSLFIFGAGADAIPLAAFAKNLGWRVLITDHRAAFATKERFPDADEIVLSPPDKLSENVGNYDDNSVAVLMTHNFEHDKRILPVLLKSSAHYVGILGPRRRTESILSELFEAGEKFGELELEKLYAPVGLDIGADTPESIALSIVAEIQSVLAGREGGFLRKRQGSIYNRTA